MTDDIEHLYTFTDFSGNKKKINKRRISQSNMGRFYYRSQV